MMDVIERAKQVVREFRATAPQSLAESPSLLELVAAALTEARAAGREEAAALIDVPCVREGREFAAAIRGMEE